ncbi:MFS transporter [Nocardioides sp.]|uniref:MFS transporter n=1 Tax=Nocardioides sp. TaxID=35761 RepID=UPI0025F52A47|nr:MFS transporter [Nocardioides sp.]
MTMKTPARAGLRQWAGLALLALPTVLLGLGVTALYLVLPNLAEDLDPTAAETLWIMDVYGFFIAGFLITMGTLGDRFGRRRMLMIGAVAFGAASVMAAFAPTAMWLIVARALLGVAGATPAWATDHAQAAFVSGLNAAALAGASASPLLRWHASSRCDTCDLSATRASRRPAPRWAR